MNKDAAIARDGKGETWKPVVKIENSYEVCPKLKPFSPLMGEDQTGKRFDKVRVVGLAAEQTASGKAGWACRCDCGRFAKFSTRGLFACAAEKKTMCGECAYLDKIKTGGGRTPLERKNMAEKVKQRSAKQAQSVAERDALVHPAICAVYDSIVLGGAVDRENFLKSIANFVQVERTKDRIAKPDEPTEAENERGASIS